MSNQKEKKPGNVSRALGGELELRFRQYVDGLSQTDAEWLRDHFGHVTSIIGRRPVDGLLSWPFLGSHEVQAFESRRETLAAAGLLPYPVEHYETDTKAELFPGAYDGPAKVHFDLYAFAMGGPRYDARVKGVPPGLPKKEHVFRARGLRTANFHQLVTFAALMANTYYRHPDRWMQEFGPCCIFGLGSRAREGDSEIVPTVLSPGAEYLYSSSDDLTRWRMRYTRADRNEFDGVEARFLMVTPA